MIAEIGSVHLTHESVMIRDIEHSQHSNVKRLVNAASAADHECTSCLMEAEKHT